MTPHHRSKRRTHPDNVVTKPRSLLYPIATKRKSVRVVVDRFAVLVDLFQISPCPACRLSLFPVPYCQVSTVRADTLHHGKFSLLVE